MQEYWVNVYPGYSYGDKLPTRLIAAERDGGASIYRIHVKMKPAEPLKPIYDPRKARKAISHHWMDI